MQQGLGYSIDINNVSVGNIPTINELSWIKVVPLPYSFLTEIRIEKPGFENKIKQTISLNFTDLGFYKTINLPFDTPDGATIILNQAFEKGWVAFANGKLLNHVLINNWANGWQINDQSPITIIYWPQYLEFLGFGLLILVFILLIL
jgi:hypothetical protein